MLTDILGNYVDEERKELVELLKLKGIYDILFPEVNASDKITDVRESDNDSDTAKESVASRLIKKR